MITVDKLSWADRFKVANHFGVTDASVLCRAFRVSLDELEAARLVASKGFIDVKSSTVVPDHFKDIFNIIMSTATDSTGITTVSAGDTVKSEVATVAEAKKKTGPKTSKIATAFAGVPTAPVSAEAYAKDKGVSISVLRQHTRFDKSGLPGTVQVRKDKATGTLMVWRATSTPAAETAEGATNA